MKKTTNTTEEKTSLLKPFPFVENEKYLLKLKTGEYLVAYWENGEFNLDYGCEISPIDEGIESLIALKDLGL